MPDKQCTKCHLTLNHDDFYVGRKSCKHCHRLVAKDNYYSGIQRHRRRYLENRDTIREKVIFKKYRLTSEQYLEMLHEQGGVCAICCRPPSPKRKLAVDHCHSSGVVRGLLCSNCNSMIGLASDSPSVLSAAIDYLQKTSKVFTG